VNLLGFYLGLHDSNVCAVSQGRVRYRKFERRSGVKHERVDLRAIVETCEEWGFEPEYVAFSDGNRNGLGACDIGELFAESKTELGLRSVQKAFSIDHHYAHILSAWPCWSSDTPTIGIALDGRGDNNVRARVVRLGSGVDAESIFHSTEFAVGRFFTLVGRGLGFEGPDIDFAGKVMGAQAYGTPDLAFVARHIEDPWESLPRRLLKDISWRGTMPATHPGFFRMENESFRDWLSTCHLLLRSVVERFFLSFCGSDEVIVYSGGCAQNTVFNRRLSELFSRLVVPPHAYDGGQALGCVEFLRRYLALPALTLSSFPFSQDDEWISLPSSATIARVASLLADGRVVGWMTGHGEIGPRALGHRSILFDPRSRDAKETLNRRVKFREPWRPYAASVLEEAANQWFDTDGPAPYMLEAIPVRLDSKEQIPGVTHRDGTCRIQTVSSSEGLESFRELLTRFSSLTGVPVLLNTSLNRAGEPIYGCAKQARELLSTGGLDALCVGDSLLLSGGLTP
jgi:carbamoyltransferase